MDKVLRNKLVAIAKKKISNDDPSHDFEHILRVLANAEMLARKEKADLDIVIPSALFHDLVNYPKNSPKALKASNHSAKETKKILQKMKQFPKQKIAKVCYAIDCCSFSKAIIPKTIEAKILQDADGLEAVGAISILRTFSSTGQMKRAFYDANDPFCKKRKPNSIKYGLDLFYTRLLIQHKRLHTKTAKKIAKYRTKFLHIFLKQLEKELSESK